VEEMLDELRPQWNAVSESPVFSGTVAEGVDEEVWRRIILEFFCVVEAFPKYMGVYLGRTTYGKSPGDVLARDWLIGNIRTEALHAQWFIDWGIGLGLTEEDIIAHRPGAEVASLYEYLWSVSYRGSLAEAFGAVNYAIEGTTGDWTRLVMPAFKERYGDDRHTLMWLAEHVESRRSSSSSSPSATATTAPPSRRRPGVRSNCSDAPSTPVSAERRDGRVPCPEGGGTWPFAQLPHSRKPGLSHCY